MTALEKIQQFIETLDDKSWYRYVAAYAAALICIIAVIIFFYYRATSYWIDTINDTNNYRERARSILQKAARVYSQRAEVNKIIQQDPDFKIAGYLQEVMASQGISSLLTNINTTQVDREDIYRETTSTVQFTGMSMRKLTEFLNVIEQNKRLYTKEIDISKSKKTPQAIDVTVVITTMQPRQTAGA